MTQQNLEALNGICKWSFDRMNPTIANNSLRASGNMFYFTRMDHNTTTYHFYLTVDSADPDKLKVFGISSENDLNFNGTQGMLLNLIDEPVTQSNPPIGFNLAAAWVGNWRNETVFNQWFDANIKDGIFQLFVVDISDFAVNEIHECYLSLKNNNELTVTSETYIADLVVYNKALGQLVYPKADTGIYDFAAPVPPFKPNSKTASTNFGVLRYIKEHITECRE